MARLALYDSGPHMPLSGEILAHSDDCVEAYEAWCDYGHHRLQDNVRDAVHTWSLVGVQPINVSHYSVQGGHGEGQGLSWLASSSVYCRSTAGQRGEKIFLNGCDLC